METHVFEIYIKTTPERLWQAITDPEERAKYSFGVKVHSDWTPGSSYESKASWGPFVEEEGPIDISVGLPFRDAAGAQLKHLLGEHRIGCRGLIADATRTTSVKTRVVAHKQQVVRIDRESHAELKPALSSRLLRARWVVRLGS